MKRLIVLGIIAMMITACSVAAHAYAGVQLNVNPTNPNGSFQTVTIGWMTDTSAGNTGGAPTTNGLDAFGDGVNGTSPIDGSGAVIMEVINATIGGAKVNIDFRQPIVAPTDFQIWRLKTYVEAGTHAGATIGLQASFGEGFAPAGTVFYIFNASYTQQSSCENAIGGSLQIAKLGVGGTASFDGGSWAINAPNSSVWQDPDDPENPDATSVAWAANPSKTFTVYAKQVPEPGSMLAIFSGVIGLVGFGIRRRK